MRESVCMRIFCRRMLHWYTLESHRASLVGALAALHALAHVVAPDAHGRACSPTLPPAAAVGVGIATRVGGRGGREEAKGEGASGAVEPSLPLAARSTTVQPSLPLLGHDAVLGEASALPAALPDDRDSRGTRNGPTGSAALPKAAVSPRLTSVLVDVRLEHSCTHMCCMRVQQHVAAA